MVRIFRINKELFTTIFRTNHWGSKESVSGPGAEMKPTRKIRRVLPKIIKRYHIRSMLDIPCGDFNWMKAVDLRRLDEYTGADIVSELIASNIKKYSDGQKKFIELDIINNPLPRVDLIFCRDCFVHLSNKDICKALKNIKKSGSAFLLTTTFIREDKNKDTREGKWRPINLNIKPFNLAPFIEYINTDFRDGGRNHPGNGIAIWKISDLPDNY